MFRVHYRPPESLPPHPRDFPPREALRGREASRYDDGSNQLALMVALYLVATLGGLVLLGNFTPSSNASVKAAENTAGRW